MGLVIRGGTVVNAGERFEADVKVEKGIITAVAPGLPVPEGAKVIDGRGRLLMPAMFDAHVHFREPGFEAKEDIASGTEAAINGGSPAWS